MRERTSVQHTTSTALLCPTTLSSDSPVRLLIVFNYIISIGFLYSNGLSSNYSMISYFLQFSKYGAVKDKLLVSFCKVRLGTYLQNKRKTLIPRSQHPQNAQSQHFCKYELMWSILLWSCRKPAVPLFDLNVTLRVPLVVEGEKWGHRGADGGLPGAAVPTPCRAAPSCHLLDG